MRTMCKSNVARKGEPLHKTCFSLSQSKFMPKILQNWMCKGSVGRREGGMEGASVWEGRGEGPRRKNGRREKVRRREGGRERRYRVRSCEGGTRE